MMPESFGFSVLLLLTIFATALVGCVFLVVVWARLFVEQMTQHGLTLMPVWTFTIAILFDALAIGLIYLRDLNASFDLPVLSLVSCWLFLFGTLFLTRRKSGPGIGSLKIGSTVLLVFGCVGLISLVSH